MDRLGRLNLSDLLGLFPEGLLRPWSLRGLWPLLGPWDPWDPLGQWSLRGRSGRLGLLDLWGPWGPLDPFDP